MAAIKDQIFVEVALRKGAIDPSILRQALETHAELGRFGITRFTAAIVVEKHPQTRKAVAEVLEDLDEYGMRCHRCKEPAAVADADRHGHLWCKDCGAFIEHSGERISEEDLAISVRPSPGRRRDEHPRRASGPSTAPPPSQGAPSGGEQGGEFRSKGVNAEQRGESPSKGVKPGRFVLPPAESRSPEARRQNPALPQGAAEAGRKRPPAPARQPSPARAAAEPSPMAEVTKFRIEKLVAASPAGKLYRISPSGELGALKIIDRTLCADKARLKRWIDYMQAVQDLRRSATLKPAQLFREGSVTYVVRPYLSEPARGLRAALDAGGGDLDGEEAVSKLAVEILTSLLAFHSARLVHGNLKPENVLLTEAGACLSDPGICLLFQGLPGEERTLRLWEKSRYHAPEVLQGSDPTPASDIYSTGRILEDVLGSGGKMEPEDAPQLGKILKRMVAEDPIERYPSAKEALWDLHSSGGEKTSAGPRPVRLWSRSRPGARGRRIRIASTVVLAAVLIGLSYQTVSWYVTRKAMASPRRPEEVSGRLIEEEIEALGRKTMDGSIPPADAEKEWTALARLLRGTEWEERARESSLAPLEEIARRREAEVSARIAWAGDRAAAREWPLALAALLSLEGVADTAARRELLRKAADGLYQDEGMVCIPGGTSPGGREVKPFLLDAGLVGRDPGSSAAGLSHGTAVEVAAAMNKRLPTGPEWDHAAALVRSGKAPAELSLERLTDLEGTLFQWVEDECVDDLSRSGHGWCRGGSRPGVPPAHPLRRRKDGSFPDVGARLARDLPALPK